jgi:hypothetical protein
LTHTYGADDVIVLSCSNRFPLSKSDSLDKQNKNFLLILFKDKLLNICHIWIIFSFLSIQPIYYQQQPTTTLLATAGTQQTLSTLIPNQTATTLNGAHTSQNQSTGGPSYYELTYATAPLSSASLEQPSYIYATGPGQTFSYAQLPTGANQQQTGPTNLNDVYGNHTAKYMIDDHNGPVDRDHHQRAAAGW